MRDGERPYSPGSGMNAVADGPRVKPTLPRVGFLERPDLSNT
jgi:hypothetical protein